MTKKEAKLKKEVNQLLEDHALLSGGWKLTGTNIGDAVQRYIDKEKTE